MRIMTDILHKVIGKMSWKGSQQQKAIFCTVVSFVQPCPWDNVILIISLSLCLCMCAYPCHSLSHSLTLSLSPALSLSLSLAFSCVLPLPWSLHLLSKQLQDGHEKVAEQISRDVSQLCSQLAALWSRFLGQVVLNPHLLSYLAQEHHTLRVSGVTLTPILSLTMQASRTAGRGV